MSTVKVVLLDIEGTVCPISFVKDVLFPYALDALPGTLEAEWDEPHFVRYRDAFPAEHRASPASLEAHARDLMAQDVKAPYLKSLQGYLWETGYANGKLTAPLFPDVAPAITAWARDSNGEGGVSRRVIIYSSGSVPAQKLLFRHTNGEPRDVTPLITDYFDTVNAGPKMEAASYAVIADKYAEGVERSQWLFLSDNVAEVKAAIEAGMQSYIVQRPGNAELPAGAEGQYRVIRSFDELDLGH